MLFQDLHLKAKEHYGDKCVLTKDLTSDMLSSSCIGTADQGIAVIILDDANCSSLVDSKLVLEIAIALSHHKHIVLYILVQSMTCSGSKVWLTIRRNCSQLFLFSLSRDQHYLKILNSELFGAIKSKGCNFVSSAYLMSQADSKQEGRNHFYLWINSGMDVAFVSLNYSVTFFYLKF